MSAFYIGLDVHKKTISYCRKLADGSVVDEGVLTAERGALRAWRESLPADVSIAMEATMFTGWIYDELRPHGEVLVGNPLRMRAIVAGKRKTDTLDARTIADLLRAGLLPETYMAEPVMRELRRVLRYRNLLVRQMVTLKNRGAALLMEAGTAYNKRKLYQRKYFDALISELREIPETVMELLQINHRMVDVLHDLEQRLLTELARRPELAARVERLQSIRGVGPVLALTWAVEIGDVRRFPNARKAISYCGLCAAERESAGRSARLPLSKQRNAHLQTILVEAAKLAPRFNPELAEVHARASERGPRNRATLAVARKLVTYLLAVDRKVSGEGVA